MIDKGFFNKTELDFISGILHYVNEHIDIDLKDALKVFGIKNVTTTEYLNKVSKNSVKIQCKALVNNGKQCSRSIKHNEFCLIHSRLYEAGKLDIQSIVCKNDNISRFDIILKKLREGRNLLKMQELRFIYLDGDEYLYHPYTKRVYDICTYERIGKIDKFRQLKLYEKIDE
jgi:hypothetical protein